MTGPIVLARNTLADFIEAVESEIARLCAPFGDAVVAIRSMFEGIATVKCFVFVEFGNHEAKTDFILASGASAFATGAFMTFESRLA